MSGKASIDQVMKKSAAAGLLYAKISTKEKAAFLRAIAQQIEALGDELIQTANKETHLPEARLQGERGRTVNQLLAFAKLLEAGDWVNASIDTADAERKPLPKPDLRKMFFPIGPVVVFGASNFPFAYSTAGGDTASALAAGCAVVVKSHPAHQKTSALVASAIAQAITLCNMPDSVFQHVEDSSIEAGRQLIQHPLTKAGAFTGSLQGGKSLFDLSNQRKEPIPFFAEMGSVNPVIVLPGSVLHTKDLPATLAASITQGVGQFCTNPGLLFVLEGEGLDTFIQSLAEKMTAVAPATMLHKGIASSYLQRKKETLSQRGVRTLAEVAESNEDAGAPALAIVSGTDFITNEHLSEEVFGPFSLIVRCTNKDQLLLALNNVQGQLTCSIFNNSDDLTHHADLIETLQQRCGRLIFNGVPTGVEVNKSMHHGGPFPASTDSRFTSVGVDAIYRFVRPVSFQNFPASLLPVELQNKNATNILRCINGEWTRDDVS